ncbi:hypothetical protein AWV80_18750 [Cupriavidus sp. UYMU48A]|nr:hypothetical protein AWV80_18750 [Cupriavidus sp. UYMU48A]
MIEQCAFTVLSGFLGSGKTTLLSTYLACSDISRVAVIVNDVGEVNIDGAVLALQDGVPMATLSNGCVCCSLTNDLPYTIDALVRERRLSGQPSYTQIILECSGLSDPGGVMRSLSALAGLGMRVRVVTTYACDRHVAPEDFSLLAQQVSAAHTIVLTRTDLVSTRQIVDAATEAKSLGPMGRIIVETAPEARARAAFDAPATLLLSDPSHVPSGRYESQHPRINVFSLQWNCELPWDQVAAWLENLAFYFDSRLLRTKGLVALKGGDVLLIQGVGQHFDTPRKLDQLDTEGSSLVVICRDALESEVIELAPQIPGMAVSARTAGTKAIKLARPRHD